VVRAPAKPAWCGGDSGGEKDLPRATKTGRPSETSPFRLEVFVEHHTLSQFEGDSKHFLPIILACILIFCQEIWFRIMDSITQYYSIGFVDSLKRKTYSGIKKTFNN